MVMPPDAATGPPVGASKPSDRQEMTMTPDEPMDKDKNMDMDMDMDMDKDMDMAMPAASAGSDKAMAPAQHLHWAHFANMTVGIWLITGAFAISYGSRSLQVSDVISGMTVLGLAVLSLSRKPFWKLWAPWANTLVGVWLLFAPLVFWAPTSAVYANDTLVGALVIAFAVLAPGMPMAAGRSMEPGPDVPPGWSYNPSSWPQRAPIIALALVGFFQIGRAHV